LGPIIIRLSLGLLSTCSLFFLSGCGGAKRAVKPKPATVQVAGYNDNHTKFNEINPAVYKKSVKVRVLMDRVDQHKKTTWSLGVPGGFVVRDPESGRVIVRSKKYKAEVKVGSGNIFVNGHKIDLDSVLVVPKKDKPITFNGTVYHGAFLATKAKERIYLINVVDLEDYLFSVVRWEGWPGWPLEVNKVFAVVCRSYVLHKMLLARRLGVPYHIKNSNIHQTYNGTHKHEIVRKAVEQTKGIFLSYDGQPIDAMYDACCGGVIPAKSEMVDLKKAPYLARKKACTFCKKSRLYRWRQDYTVTRFEALFQRLRPGSGHLRGIKVCKRDGAGLVKEVRVVTSKGAYNLNDREIYSLCKRIKSFHFNVGKYGKVVVFKGRGYGHHMGVCQWGVRQMVEEGWHYRSILAFFYPGVQFMELMPVD
jgi:stage II sporulation protein D